MKLWMFFGLAAAFAVVCNAGIINDVEQDGAIKSVESRNILINQLVNQMFNYIRRVINQGSSLLNIPPLDPYYVDHVHLDIPAGLVNLNLEIEKAVVRGIGGFRVRRSALRISDLTFDLEIVVPRLQISCQAYDLIGDLFTAIPLYGKGNVNFELENFSFRAMLFLKQSEDGESVVIDRIENAGFEMPVLKSEITGVIGGGDIDAIVNAIISEVITDYVNRFSGALTHIVVANAVDAVNPILNQLDTWKYLRPFVPSH